MNSIDFLNFSPQYYIFERRTNKTNFGGILFLIYMIIMFFICLVYILDYALNDKYEIESYIIEVLNGQRYEGDYWFKNYEDYEELEKSLMNPEINKNVFLSIEVAVLSFNLSTDINEIMNKTFLKYGNIFYKGILGESNCYYEGNFCYYSIIFNITKNITEFDENHYKKYINIIYKDYLHNFPNYLRINYINILTKRYEINHEDSTPIKIGNCNPPSTWSVVVFLIISI